MSCDISFDHFHSFSFLALINKLGHTSMPQTVDFLYQLASILVVFIFIFVMVMGSF